jgi:hypothetical protein
MIKLPSPLGLPLSLVVRHPADDMNIRTLKYNIWPNDANLWVGIDSDKGTKRKYGVGLDRGQLGLQRIDLALQCGNGPL